MLEQKYASVRFWKKRTFSKQPEKYVVTTALYNVGMGIPAHILHYVCT